MKITKEDIESIHQQVMKEYGSEFAVIHIILKEYPCNTKHNIVLTKIKLIDFFNTTQLIKHNKKITRSDIADIILNIKDFDKRIFIGDPSLVSDFANEIKRKGVNLFSFATKYCAFHTWFAHGKDDYSIYDSRVHSKLKKLVLPKKIIETWREECKYEEFNNCIGEILDQNNIHIPKRRYKFDHFLWFQN